MKKSVVLYFEISDAARCRRNHWGPGTVLEGDEGDGPERITITAVGRERILAIGADGYEADWSLEFRKWKKVKTKHGRS